MGLRRYMKTGERETFLVVFIVLAGLAAYLGPWGGKPSPTPPLPPLVASDGGMEKLWLEASLGKGDLRPIPDELSFADDSEPSALPAAAAPAEPTALTEAAAPAPAFPEPLPVTEAAPERRRIAPMGESLLDSSRSGSSSSAFLPFPPARHKEAARAPAAPAPAPASSAAASPPKRRVMRPLMGN